MGRDICFGAKVKIKTCENEDRKKRTLPPPNHFTNTRKRPDEDKVWMDRSPDKHNGRTLYSQRPGK
uniref:Uncharacterized protein n=1 Tax=Magallana gigas TaxID=29159 RepID=K1QMV9_MAGGI